MFSSRTAYTRCDQRLKDCGWIHSIAFLDAQSCRLEPDYGKEKGILLLFHNLWVVVGSVPVLSNHV